mmetsp:Transcript_7184/g.18738  ORF Transcript_7184/g.18738 Transcript_7184/m.18738 type:complete len:103 (+) Transcript_7184:710-1018(+)
MLRGDTLGGLSPSPTVFGRALRGERDEPKRELLEEVCQLRRASLSSAARDAENVGDVGSSDLTYDFSSGLARCGREMKVRCLNISTMRTPLEVDGRREPPPH